MSLSNLSSGFNLSLDGLNVINADIIYINGQDISQTITGNYVPYSGASTDINLNGKSLNNTNIINATTGNITNIVGSSLKITSPASNVPFFQIPDNTGQIILFGSSTGKQFYTEFKNSPTEHMRLGYYNGSGKTIVINDTTSGNVIIGNHNNIFNNYRLDVNGDINSRQNIYIQTALYTDAINPKTLNGIITFSNNNVRCSFVPSNNADLINLLYLTNNYYTKSNIDTTLTSYYTKTQIDTTLTNYYTKTNIDTTLTNYYTKTNIDTNIYTKTQSDANYYNKTYIDTLISSYYTKTQIDTTFTNYYTKTNIDTTLTNYYTKTNIDTNIYTKTQSDANYYNKTYIDTLISSYYTKTQIDTTLTSYYNKTSTDTLLNAKANLSGAIFTGVVSMGANKITSTYVPINNEDLINKLYLTNNYYTSSATDTLLNAKATITYVNTQNALKISKAGDTMSGNLEILTSSIPYLLVSYSGYAYLPSVDTDVGLLRFHHNRDQNNKFCDVKATVRVGQYMPSIVFATNPVYSATNVNRMIITENGNVGINIMSPSTLFYVNGTTTLNGNTTVGGILDTGANKITSSFTATANTDITNKLFVDTAITTSKTNLLSGINTWTAGQIFNVGLTSNGNLDVGSNRAICNRVPTFNDDLTNKLYIDNSFVTFATYYYNKTTTDTLLNAKANLSGASFTGDVSTSGTFIGKATIRALDLRNVKPSDLGAGYLTFHFGSYPNNGGSSYSDCIHFNTYIDSSGGSQNLLMLLKSGIGLRIYQGAFGSTTAYSTYKDAILIDNTNTINFNTLLTSSALNINTTNTQDTNIGNTTGNITLNSAIYMPNIPQGSALYRKFLTLTPQNKLEYLSYGWGFSSIFDLNVGSTSNWGAGTLKMNAFGTTRQGSSQQVLFSGHVSGYSQIAGQVVTIKLRTNPNGSTNYTYEDIKFYVNASYTHIVFPINFVRNYNFGSYDAYIYVSSSNFLTDIGDLCYLNATVLF
jgi:hypothetical protein